MIKIRPYKATDAATVIGWLNEERTFYKWSAGTMGEFPLTEQRMAEYTAEIGRDIGTWQLVAYDDIGTIGYVELVLEEGNSAQLRRGIVAFERRRSGLGKQMVKMAVKLAFDYANADKVYVNVFDVSEAAYLCYQSAGFWEIKQNTADTYSFGEEVWTIRRMEAYPEDAAMYAPEADIPEEAMIKEIIDRNSFRYAFQPIVEASTGDIYGYEALMRAEYNGLISPDSILELANKFDYLYDIEKATLFNVFEQVQSRREQFGNRKVFVNCIPGKLLNVEDYAELLYRYGDHLENYVMEITEATELCESEWSLLQRRSRSEGFKLAIDDYGTGYSNTSNLVRFMPNCIKIDRLLISKINEDDKKQHFVKSIIEFAHTNGILALAEGVEESAELRTVLQLGVDLIQGYYLAKPMFEVMQEIPPEIRNEMLHANVIGQTQSSRKIYVANGEKELPIVRVALEQNTGILIDQPEIILVGNTNYTAAMSIKIKDGCTCRMTIRDVFLESFLDMPCIELGRGANLTLVLVGDNKLQRAGICVPEDSSLKVEGNGSLQIRAQGIQSYGIGNKWENGFGNIELGGKEYIDILVEADDGIGIGGGFRKDGNGIKITSGVVRVEPASLHSIGIGCVQGDCPVTVSDCNVMIDLRTDTGIGIGTLEGTQNISMERSNLSIIGAGSMLAAVGSNKGTGGQVKIDGCKLNITMNGQFVGMIANGRGEMLVDTNKSTLDLKGEGSEVLGIGSWNKSGKIHAVDTDCTMTIRSGGHLAFGAGRDNISFEGGEQNIKANE